MAVVAIGAFIVLSGGGDDPTEAATASTDTSIGDESEEEVPTTTAGATTTSTAQEETATAPPSADTVSTAVSAVVDEDFSTVTASIVGGTVTLTGRAFDEDERDAATEAATMPGVTDVVDDMEVQTEDERCTDIVQSQPSWGCITSAMWDGNNVVATYVSSADRGGPALSINSGLHLHVYASSFEPTAVGTSGPFSDGSGNWQVWDTPETITVSLAQIGVADVPEKLCALIANQIHTIESLNSGTCWPIEIPEG